MKNPTCLDVPANAVQFELNDKCRELQSIDFLWVMPPHSRGNYFRTCGCSVTYTVIESLLPDHKEYIKQRRDEFNGSNAPLAVCSCFGRVIE